MSFFISLIFNDNPVSKGPNDSNTERHYQRASNHNKKGDKVTISKLKDIIKEHQITTEITTHYKYFELKDIIKEHQITTGVVSCTVRLDWKTLSKSIKSQPAKRPMRGRHQLKDIIKEHQITTYVREWFRCWNWKTLSKSIKSQLFENIDDTARTERHYQRASNHNIPPKGKKFNPLKDIIKEHQITTRPNDHKCHKHWKTLSKSIKSQLGAATPVITTTERHYQRASNHNKVMNIYKLTALKDIIKEHQITTYYWRYYNLFQLKDIIKEHQITTDKRLTNVFGNWKTLSKSIKSQL